MTRRRALVTGGAGFIGSHLVEGLVAEDWQVLVLDDLSSGSETNLAAVEDRVELLRADVRDSKALARAADGVDAIFHLAAIASVPASVADPIATGAVNVEGTLRVLEAARATGRSRVVLASSCAVYGSDADLPVREDARPDPTSPYGAQKASAEHYVQLYRRLHAVPAVALRFFNVYGPRQNPGGDYAAVIPRFVSACLAGNAPEIFGDGGQTRDFIHVEDVVRANLLAASSEAGLDGPINVASGRETSVNELARWIGEITGLSGDPAYSPARPGDVRRSVACTRRARQQLQFEARVDLREGLRRTIEGVLAA